MVLFDHVVGAALAHVLASSPDGEPRRERFLRPLSCAASPAMRESVERLADLLGPGVGAASGDPTPAASAALADELEALHASAGEPVRLALRLLLGCAVRRLIPHMHLPADGRLPAVALQCLARLQADRPLYVGRPRFVTRELLDRLRAEAEAGLATATLRGALRGAHLGPAGRELAGLPELGQLISLLAGPMEPSGAGGYLYCDDGARGMGMHLFPEPFAINAEVKLWHTCPSPPPARIVFAPPYASTARAVSMAPGDLALWFAGGVPHAREPVGGAERMAAVSIFFEPVLP